MARIPSSTCGLTCPIISGILALLYFVLLISYLQEWKMFMAARSRAWRIIYFFVLFYILLLIGNFGIEAVDYPEYKTFKDYNNYVNYYGTSIFWLYIFVMITPLFSLRARDPAYNKKQIKCHRYFAIFTFVTILIYLGLSIAFQGNEKFRT